MNKKQLSILKLWLVPDLGSITYKRLIERFKTPEDVLKADKVSLASVKGVNYKVVDYLVNRKDELKRFLDKEIELINKHSVTPIFFEDELYPTLLRNIYDAPPVLFVKGRLEKIDESAVAIVGSRYSSTYGADMAYRFGRDLSQVGVTVISGLARGIDTEAHKGALSKFAKGKTIAVLGTGLARCYPRENKRLLDEIIEKGMVLSEFPMNTGPDRFNFPMRNRIISGASVATFVIEASNKSGALITARLAMEQGRDVFALPGLITNPRTKGTHSLIKDGAKIITSCEDILEELPIYNDTDICDSIIADKVPDFMSNKEKALFLLLKGEDKMQIEHIRERIGLSMTELLRLLTSMELKGFIKQYPGKFYCNAL